MGAMAEALAAYAQPLLDETDGSLEQLNHAFALSNLCYNLALLPEEGRDRMLGEMKLNLTMSDEEFEDFLRPTIRPMIGRHQEMFPQMHNRVLTGFSQNGPSLRALPSIATTAEEHPKTDRYAPCPCKSGLKYKFCCGKKDL